MPGPLKKLLVAALGLMLVAGSAWSADSADIDSATRFFQDYMKLSDAFDVSVAELYSDQAVIRSYRRYPHGLKRAMELTGIQWKALLTELMPMARASGDTNRYSNIRVEVEGSRARVTAQRYSVLKCYTDEAYFMMLDRAPDGRYYIIEEYTESQPQSAC